MSIRPESSNTRRRVLTEAEVDAITNKIDQPTIEANPATEFIRPTNLREAAGGPWVIVAPNVPLPIRGDEVAEYGRFFVHYSVLDDPALFSMLHDEMLDEWVDALPEESWKEVDLNEVDPMVDNEKYRTIGIYTIGDIKRIQQDMKRCPYILKDHIPAQAISITVGDSGLGKSPLKYQFGICVAAGVKFLDIPTSRGRVLYLDYENNTEQIRTIAEAVAKFLGLPGVPDAFQIWSPALPEEKPSSILDRVKTFRPALVIVDTLSAAFPNAESENKNTSELYKLCRGVMRETGCTFDFVHHMKKTTWSNNDGPSDDSSASAREVLKNTRGASALVNNADARWSITRSGKDKGEIAFRIGGYLRGVGEHPPIAVARVCDEDGNPIGYRRLGGVSMLTDQCRKVYDGLPEKFRWKDLEPYFQTSDNAKTLFIKAATSAGIVEKRGKEYFKIQEA
jgi:hypothetical protein